MSILRLSITSNNVLLLYDGDEMHLKHAMFLYEPDIDGDMRESTMLPFFLLKCEILFTLRCLYIPALYLKSLCVWKRILIKR